MGDINRAVSLRRNLQKHAGRAKELFRQNLGKADKTTDEGFDEYVKNFNAQQSAAIRLTKEVKNYNASVKALQVASKSLMELLCELYEEHWVDHDKVQVQAELLDKKWVDFHTTVEELVIKPLNAYSEQFTDVNNKILKRRRKLLDYDCCRHTIQNLEHSTRERKKDEYRLNKAKEHLAEKQSLYEAINSELMDELPALWESRVAFYASNFQCLFIAEATFHNQLFKVFDDLNDAVEALAKENQKGIYAVKRYPVGECMPEISSSESNISTQRPCEGESSSSEYLSSENPVSSENETAALKLEKPETNIYTTEGNGIQLATKSEQEVQKLFARDSDEQMASLVMSNHVTPGDTKDHKLSPKAGKKQKMSPMASEKESSPTTNKKLNSFSSVQEPSLPPGVLQRVKASFQYVAEDSDELSFDPGDIIYVIDFDDPDQQEEGWLMGYKEETGEKGLFPANFTRAINSSFTKEEKEE